MLRKGWKVSSAGAAKQAERDEEQAALSGVSCVPHSPHQPRVYEGDGCLCYQFPRTATPARTPPS
jgi:hypothetical protein|eukprot:COSAG01_NODE_12495_length_1729_cov_1.871166_2_plen_65_part_00